MVLLLIACGQPPTTPLPIPPTVPIVAVTSGTAPPTDVPLENVTALSHAGDLDGDGSADLFAVASGRVWMVHGPLATGRLAGRPWAPAGGYHGGAQPTGLGDLDGDGIAEWWLAGGAVGELYSGSSPVSLASATLDQPPKWFRATADAADFDDDGQIDLLASRDLGLVLLAGPLAGAPLERARIERQPGTALLFHSDMLSGQAADMDADGVLDIVSWILPGVDEYEFDSRWDGSVHVHTNPNGALAYEDADAILTGASTWTEVLDWDGDGAADVAMFGDEGWWYTGAPTVRVVTGPDLDGRDTATDAVATITFGTDALARPPATSPGDVDGDGRNDLVVHSRTETWLLSGGATGTVDGAATATVLADDDVLVAWGSGDVDGDGLDDIVLLDDQLNLLLLP